MKQGHGGQATYCTWWLLVSLVGMICVLTAGPGHAGQVLVV